MSIVWAEKLTAAQEAPTFHRTKYSNPHALHFYSS